jgi:hypothetical protein
MTTLTSYGTVAPHRQAELIRGIGLAGGGAGNLGAQIDAAVVAQVIAALQALPGKGLA